MESLLKMSGLLTEEEAGRTDLGTLEKRLADKATSNSNHRTESPKPSRSGGSSLNNTDSQRETPQLETQSSPRDSATSPTTEGGDKEKREEVENLSDLMCSLVTNNVGETRYIGNPLFDPYCSEVADNEQALLPLSPFSPVKELSGSIKRLVTLRSRRPYKTWSMRKKTNGCTGNLRSLVTSL